MLNNDEICLLKQDEAYKKTYGFFYNRKYTKGIYSTSIANFSLSFSSSGAISIGNIIKGCWGVCKYFIICVELGRFRNEIVERFFDKTTQCPIVIEYLILPNCYWLEKNVDKVSHIQRITYHFLTEPETKKLICNYAKEISSSEISNNYNDTVEMINVSFDDFIEKLRTEKTFQTFREYRDSHYTNNDKKEMLLCMMQNATNGALTGDMKGGSSNE